MVVLKRILLPFLFVAFLPAWVCAKSFSIERVEVLAAVQPNGQVHITERRTYQFNGEFSQADYILPRRGFDEISAISISEHGESYLRTDGGRDEGTFFIREFNNRIELVWNYRARDEIRTFEISYLLDGALIVGYDYAEFFWTYLSNRWERSTGELKVEFLLPEPSTGDVHTWVRGAHDAIQLQSDNLGFFITSTRPITRRESVSVRAVFSTESIPNAALTHPTFSLAEAYQDEEQRRIQNEESEARRAFWLSINERWGWMIILISLGSFFHIYHRYGRRHRPSPPVPQQLFEPPMKIAPAVAGKLVISMGMEAMLLTATLFDLARRGYFLLTEKELYPKSKWVPAKQTLLIERGQEASDPSGLLPYEQHLYDFFTSSMVNGRVSLAALFESSSISSSVKKQHPDLFETKVDSSKVSTWYMSWIKELGTYMNRFNWYDKTSTKWMIIALAVQLALTGISVALLVLAFTPLIMISIMVTIIMAVFSIAIRRRTPEAQEQYLRWVAYRNGLASGSAQDLQMFDSSLHLIYAIALGITGKKFTQCIERIAHEDEQWLWITFAHGGTFNPAAISGSVSSITASTTSSFSGGGASVGSAGGGAGGGAR